jgi:hypothetical protein
LQPINLPRVRVLDSEMPISAATARQDAAQARNATMRASISMVQAIDFCGISVSLQ